MATSTVELRWTGNVKRERIRSPRDRRVRVLRVTAEYTDGVDVFRKSFEVRDGKTPNEPIVPVYGSHDELNAARHQWTYAGLRAARDLS